MSEKPTVLPTVSRGMAADNDIAKPADWDMAHLTFSQYMIGFFVAIMLQCIALGIINLSNTSLLGFFIGLLAWVISVVLFFYYVYHYKASYLVYRKMNEYQEENNGV